MGTVARAMPAKAEFAVQDIADRAGHKKDEQQRKIGIDMKEGGNEPISSRDKQGKQPAAYAEPDNLPDQRQPLLIFAHVFCLTPASHLSQRL